MSSISLYEVNIYYFVSSALQTAVKLCCMYVANMHYRLSETLRTLLLFATQWHGLSIRCDFWDTILLPIFEHRVLIGGINTEHKNRCIFTIDIYTECHFYHVLVISGKKKAIVSSLRRASCNNCCARQFVKCHQQVCLMAHPVLCIRSPSAGAIDFFEGCSIVEKAWW